MKKINKIGILKFCFANFVFLMITSQMVESSYPTLRNKHANEKSIEMVEKHYIVENSPYLKSMIHAAKEAGKKMLQGFHNINKVTTSQKTSHPNDILTEYDKLTQDIAVSVLKRNHPSFKIIGEESEEQFPKNWDKGYTWVIDPIDGTLNYRYGRKDFAISIALFKDGKSIAGVIYAPARDEIYYAEAGKGAFLNASSIHVRNKPITSKPLCHFELNKIDDDEFFKAIKPIATSITQCGGSAALDLAFTAAGLNDTVLSTNLSLWDIGAGIIIMKEAGGLMVKPNGDNNIVEVGEGNCSHLAGHPDLVHMILEKLPHKNIGGVSFGKANHKIK